MSAAEVIAEIQKLPPKEREAVVSFVNASQASLVGGQSSEPATASFEQAAKTVFTKHKDLLHRLAQ